MHSVTHTILDSITSSDHVVIHTNVQLWDVHVVETIEIALQARAKGADTTVVVCNGSLSSCPANALHSSSLCGKCNNKTDHLVAFLEKHGVRVVSVPQFPSTLTEGQSITDVSTRRDLMGFRPGNAPIGRLVASQIADDLKDVYFSLTGTVRERALQHCLNGAALFEWSTRVLTEVGATKVFVWNGRRPSDGPFYYAAKKLGIEAFTYISGGRPGSVFVTTAPSVQEVRPEEVATDIRALSEQFASAPLEGMSRLNDYRFGTYQQVGYNSFDQPILTSAQNLTAPILEWLNAQSRRIFLPTSSPSEQIHIEEVDSLFGDDPYAWIERLQARVAEAGLALLVRWHPAQNRPGTGEHARINEIAHAAPPGVHHILPQEAFDAYFLAAESDIVVTTGSTVAIWAAATNKPVIHMDPRPHFLEAAWTRVSSEDDLWQALQEPRSSTAEAAQLWSLYAAERGEQMRHVSWSDGKPLAPHLPKTQTMHWAVRKLQRLHRSIAHLRRALSHRLSASQLRGRSE